MKCDKKEEQKAPKFEPESPYVIVCEGFQDLGLICALLEKLGITNCDVTYPKKIDGGNGKDAIRQVVTLLAGRPLVEGVLLIADADGNAADSFKVLCAGMSRFPVPKAAFIVEKTKSLRSGIFLLPGHGKTGNLEHLLLDVVRNENPGIITHVEAFRAATAETPPWSANKDAKMKMQCVVAATCKKNPYCSLSWIWSDDYKSIPVKIDSPVLEELSDFLKAFAA